MPAEPASRLPMSREEYLAMDREAERKHELASIYAGVLA